MTTRRWVWLGLLGGLLGGVFMAIVEMTSELLMGHSMFTPMAMIAAPVVGMGAMERTMMGGAFYLEPVPTLLGMIGHLIWAGPVWGIAFGLIAAGARIVGQAALWWGLAYGVATGFVMSALVLPIFGLQPLWETAPLVSFFLMHLAYGLGPGLVIWSGSRRQADVPVAAPQRHAA